MLFHEPLGRTAAPDGTLVIVLDALDEVPRDRLVPLLEVIATELRRLPGWLRLFVTSREEHYIKAKLQAFEPTELRVDEERNRQDVRSGRISRRVYCPLQMALLSTMITILQCSTMPLPYMDLL